MAIPANGTSGGWGRIVAALAGAGAGGATGGLVGGLIGAGIPEVEAKRYAGRIREGGYLISVHCDDRDWCRRAKEILEATSGQRVVSTSEATTDFVRDASASLNRFAAVIVGGHPQPDRLCVLVVVGQVQPFSTIAFFHCS